MSIGEVAQDALVKHYPKELRMCEHTFLASRKLIYNYMKNARFQVVWRLGGKRHCPLNATNSFSEGLRKR